MHGRCAPYPARAYQDLSNARLLLGKRLTVLLHDQYYFNDEKCLTDIGSCGEQKIVSMYLLSDGESVGADSLPLDTPISFEIEPGASCQWKRENLLAGLSASYLENKIINDDSGHRRHTSQPGWPARRVQDYL